MHTKKNRDADYMYLLSFQKKKRLGEGGGIKARLHKMYEVTLSLTLAINQYLLAGLLAGCW